MIRVGVIGVGHLGKHHARILSSMPGVELFGALDIVRTRAEAATGPPPGLTRTG